MSKHVKLSALTRTQLGNDAKKVRRENAIPAVIYGDNSKPESIQVDYKLFIKVYKEAGTTNVIDLEIDGKKSKPCLVHDIDVHPVKGIPRHIDFLLVNLKEKIVTSVPLTFVGESSGQKEFNAVLSTSYTEIEIEALPDNIPSEVAVDISALVDLDSVVKVSDLVPAGDYVFVTDPEVVLASLVAQTEETEEVTTDEIATESAETSQES